ncbi:MAG: hypothetical protein LH618_16595, partial [Saprospiraceae bacterium]|nr:hypothetical protein [Saprospiraceae bacterium]
MRGTSHAHVWRKSVPPFYVVPERTSGVLPATDLRGTCRAHVWRKSVPPFYVIPEQTCGVLPATDLRGIFGYEVPINPTVKLPGYVPQQTCGVRPARTCS